MVELAQWWADALQLLVKVVLLPLARRVFQPLVIHGEALHQVLVQARGGPLAELRTPMAADAETHRDDRVQIVVLHLAADLTCTLLPNYPEFPDSCLPVQLAFLENVHQVLIDRTNVLLEQLRDERLRQPQRLVFKPALNARAAILSLVEDDFGLGQEFVAHGFLRA